MNSARFAQYYFSRFFRDLFWTCKCNFNVFAKIKTFRCMYKQNPVVSLVLAQVIHQKSYQPLLEVLHNSCNICTCGLDCLSTLLPLGLRLSGNGCTYQADHSCPCYNYKLPEK